MLKGRRASVLESRNNSHVFAIALSISHLSLYLACLYCLYLYMLDIYCAILLYAWGLFAHTCIQPRESQRHHNFYLEDLEELVQSPSPGIRLYSCVILGVSSLIFFSLHK